MRQHCLGSMASIKAASCSSVGVCPGAQAAKANRAKEETPLLMRAFASSLVRATSVALLLRALVDSKEVLMLLKRKRLRESSCVQQLC